MRNRSQVVIGMVLVLLGLAYLAAILLDLDLRGSFWALILIGLGVMLLLRPAVGGSDTSEYRIIGEVKQYGPWKVSSRDFYAFIGDMKLDLTEAELPPGETVIRLNAFIADIKVTAPTDMALAISVSGVIIDSRLFGEKRDGFLSPVDLRTPGYDTAERKVRLESAAFISGLKVREG